MQMAEKWRKIWGYWAGFARPIPPFFLLIRRFPSSHTAVIGISEKGKYLENQFTCPHCKRIIANNLIIEDAARRQGSDRQAIPCECGERITYWQIAEQLRNQTNFGVKIQNWFRGLSRG